MSSATAKGRWRGSVSWLAIRVTSWLPRNVCGRNARESSAWRPRVHAS